MATVFTTEESRSFFVYYPQVIQMDTTFTTNVHEYKLIHIVCIDQFLNTASVCYGPLSDVKEETMSICVCQYFARKMGDSIYLTEVVLLDQEGADDKNIKNFFPHARILLWQFHVLKTVGPYTHSEDPQAAASLLRKCMEAQTECEFILYSRTPR